MASKPHTPTPWGCSVDFVFQAEERPFVPRTVPVADFQNAPDAVYAVKAVNMHERLVEMLRLRAFAATDQNRSNRCIQCGALGSVGKPRHNEVCELAALLKEAEDGS